MFKSQHTGLLTYCVEYQTDRGVPFEKAQERLAKEVRRAFDRCNLLSDLHKPVHVRCLYPCVPNAAGCSICFAHVRR